MEPARQTETTPQLKSRNMLSAHTTNRKHAPLWPGGNLAGGHSEVGKYKRHVASQKPADNFLQSEDQLLKHGTAF